MKLVSIILLLSLCLAVTKTAFTDPRIQEVVPVLNSKFWLPKEIGPGSGSTKCEGFWNKVGYVCEKKELEKFVSDQESSFGYSIRQVYDPRLIMQRIHSRRAAFDFTLTTQETRQLEDYVNRPYSAEESANIKTCFDYLKKARLDALCFTCSAKNYQYYFKQKAIITEGECNKMIDKCLNHLNDLMPHLEASFGPMRKYTTGVNNMIQSYRQQLKINPDARIQEIISTTIERHFQRDSLFYLEYYAKEGHHEASVYLRALKKATNEKNFAEAAKQKSLLCLSSMRLNTGVSILRLIDAIKEVTFATDKELEAITKIKALGSSTPASAVGPWPAGMPIFPNYNLLMMMGRQLNNWQQDSDLVPEFSDIMIMNTAGSLVGLSKELGLSVIPICTNFKPMNLSIAFT